MKPASFAYMRPNDLDQAIAAAADSTGIVRFLAGGQSLVPMLNLRLAPVDTLVDLGALAELRDARPVPGGMLYGALLTHAAFEDRKIPDVTNGLVPYAAARIAFRSVRNRGTIGGALALADPAADWVTAIVTLGGHLHLRGKAGPRVVPAEQFILGSYLTALEEGEILTGIEVAQRSASERWGHSKVAVRVGEYAESLAMALADRAARTARLVLGAVDGAPLVLAETAAAALAGAPPEGLKAVARAEIAAAGRDFTPARLTMHVTTATRALSQALER